MQRWSLSLVTVLLQLKYVTVHFSQSTSWRCIVGVEVQLDSFLTRHWMKVNGCLHIPAALPVGKEPQYPLNKRLFGPRAGLDILEKRRIPYPYWDSNPCPSSPRSIALYRLRYLGLTKNVILRIYFNLTEIRALRNGLNSFALHKIFLTIQLIFLTGFIRCVIRSERICGLIWIERSLQQIRWFCVVRLWTSFFPLHGKRRFMGYKTNRNGIGRILYSWTWCRAFWWIVTNYLFTYSMEQSPSWEANLFSASQEIPRTLRNSNVRYRSHKLPPPVPVLSQLDPVHNPTPHFLKIHLNIILPSRPGSPKWSLSFRFPHQNPVYAFLLPHTRYMPRPSNYSRFYHPHNIGWAVQIIKLLISSRGQQTRDGLPDWGLDVVLTTPHRKNASCCETVKEQWRIFLKNYNRLVPMLQDEMWVVGLVLDLSHFC